MPIPKVIVALMSKLRSRNHTTFCCQEPGCGWSITLTGDSDVDRASSELLAHRNGHAAKRIAVSQEFSPTVQRATIRYHARRLGTTAEIASMTRFKKPFAMLDEQERRQLIRELAAQSYRTPAERYGESNREFGGR